jgi:glucosamine--fructose-6-phosphate aminotransferase (isomerizing)
VCGIFGIVGAGNDDFVRGLESLFLLSESRGKEASGLAVRDAREISVVKEPLSASAFICSAQYRSVVATVIRREPSQRLAVIGHSRLVTNGRGAIAANNQPVIKNRTVAVHNGIIVNATQIWAAHPELIREADVDTEAFLALFEKLRREEDDEKVALARAFNAIDGTASMALLLADRPQLLLGTNNGSLYVCSAGNSFHFASERYILQQAIARLRLPNVIEAVPGGHGVIVDIRTLAAEPFEFTTKKHAAAAPLAVPEVLKINDLSRRKDPRYANLRRCTQCILPETMPFIDFDRDGVCNYCRTHVPHKPLGLDALREVVEPYRSRSGAPDCLVAISGGRDSCYGLHVLKTELDLNPVAYTYDWGVLTDLGRRNQARLCGKLGIEHILVSADIPRKREYVRRNVEAWLKRPVLGMIPLFMAGDKQYFFYAERIRRQLGVEISFLCENRLEFGHFKSGFMGVNEGHARVFNVSVGKKLKVLLYHGKEYLLNPRYINRSLFDNMFAFHSAYLLKHDGLQLFDYAPWNEERIIGTLRSEYDWELAPDTVSTWRIGDGTAPFYNYIYYNVAGFTENDTFRSNQIREGGITREQALALVEVENEPRWESLQWYASTIGFSLDDALQVIAAMPRLWEQGGASSRDDAGEVSSGSRSGRLGSVISPSRPSPPGLTLGSIASQEVCRKEAGLPGQARQ